MKLHAAPLLPRQSHGGQHAARTQGQLFPMCCYRWPRWTTPRARQASYPHVDRGWIACRTAWLDMPHARGLCAAGKKHCDGEVPSPARSYGTLTPWRRRRTGPSALTVGAVFAGRGSPPGIGRQGSLCPAAVMAGRQRNRGGPRRGGTACPGRWPRRRTPARPACCGPARDRNLRRQAPAWCPPHP